MCCVVSTCVLSCVYSDELKLANQQREDVDWYLLFSLDKDLLLDFVRSNLMLSIEIYQGLATLVYLTQCFCMPPDVKGGQ